MKKKLDIIVKLNDFILYQEKTGDYYLDKKNKYIIYSPSKNKILNNFEEVNEIFNGTKTDYVINKNNNDYLILFKSNSNINYRIDLIKDINNIDLYHIGFSLLTRDTNNYDKLTNLNESKEVFSKVIYILKNVDTTIGSPEYCIGATGNLKKDRIYQYMMRFIDGWVKKNTTAYPLGWGIFFKL